MASVLEDVDGPFCVFSLCSVSGFFDLQPCCACAASLRMTRLTSCQAMLGSEGLRFGSAG